MAVKSPCRLVCKYNEDKICIGCSRTMEEIINWINYTDKEKEEVLKRVAERRPDTKKNYYDFP